MSRNSNPIIVNIPSSIDIFHNNKTIPSDTRRYIEQFLTPEMLQPTNASQQSNHNNVDLETIKAYFHTFFQEYPEVSDDHALMIYHIIKAITQKNGALYFLVPHSFTEDTKVMKINLLPHIARLTQPNRSLNCRDALYNVVNNRLNISYTGPYH